MYQCYVLQIVGAKISHFISLASYSRYYRVSKGCNFMQDALQNMIELYSRAISKSARDCDDPCEMYENALAPEYSESFGKAQAIECVFREQEVEIQGSQFMHISLRTQWRQIIMEATANRFDINMAHSLNNIHWPDTKSERIESQGQSHFEYQEQ